MQKREKSSPLRKGKITKEEKVTEFTNAQFKEKESKRKTKCLIHSILSCKKMKWHFEREFFEIEEMRKLVVKTINKKITHYEKSSENGLRSYL